MRVGVRVRVVEVEVEVVGGRWVVGGRSVVDESWAMTVTVTVTVTRLELVQGWWESADWVNGGGSPRFSESKEDASRVTSSSWAKLGALLLGAAFAGGYELRDREKRKKL